MQKLTHLQQIKQEVERRVAIAIIPLLLEKIKRSHIKRKYTDCGCTYCETKRKASESIANAPFGQREYVRDFFREKLEKLFYE